MPDDRRSDDRRSDDRPRPPRARRRAVGPPGARPSAPGLLADHGRPADEEPPGDDDDRLRQDVPPHHGS